MKAITLVMGFGECIWIKAWFCFKSMEFIGLGLGSFDLGLELYLSARMVMITCMCWMI